MVLGVWCITVNNVADLPAVVAELGKLATIAGVINAKVYTKANPSDSDITYNFNDEDNVIVSRIKFADKAACEAFSKHPVLAAVKANLDGKRKIRYSCVAYDCK